MSHTNYPHIMIPRDDQGEIAGIAEALNTEKSLSEKIALLRNSIEIEDQ